MDGKNHKTKIINDSIIIIICSHSLNITFTNTTKIMITMVNDSINHHYFQININKNM
jgi:hypothetical protein